MAIGDILRNNVKDKLARDEVVASMTVRLVRGSGINRSVASVTRPSVPSEPVKRCVKS